MSPGAPSSYMLQNMFNNNSSSSNNNQHHHHDQTMGPRISFSSDFMDSNQLGYELGTAAYKEAPVSSDFEFSAMGCGSRLTPADEIFFQGKLLPADELGCSDHVRRIPMTTTTLREELLVGEDGNEPPRRSSGSGGGRWMERLRLKKGWRHRGKSLETVEEEVMTSQDPSRKQQQEGLAEAGRQSFRSARG